MGGIVLSNSRGLFPLIRTGLVDGKIKDDITV